jgi:beta-glucanase (GH16 family)
MSPDNRSETANHIDHVYVDPKFGGLTGCGPLGLDPFVATPGQLKIRATRLSPIQAKCLGRGWASGLMTTAFSFTQKWGYFEADISVPQDAGFWPAFWLLPVTGPWPEHGEIDALESVGPATQGGQPRTHVGIVWKSPMDGSRGEAGGFTGVMTPGFHKYGVLWTPATVNFYIDRRLTSSVKTPSDFSEPMYMIINLAVGAQDSWPGAPSPDTHQAELVIRRVEAWKLKTD